jgi:18S rRNA (guanine1575-N7)-methyltransferase
MFPSTLPQHLQLSYVMKDTFELINQSFNSISVLQWLLNADSSSHSPPQRLTRFFTTLHASLRNPSRAIFQFYPSSDDQVHMITQSAQRAGFGGGVVVDYPNSRKARKMYLCLMVGQAEIPKGLDGEEMKVGDAVRRREEIQNERRRRRESAGGAAKGKKRKDVAAKDWILKKKELYRVRGKEGYVRSTARSKPLLITYFHSVPRDSKYTARKRRVQF